MDEPNSAVYPTQKMVSGKDPVFVGRLHQDLNDPHLWIFWVVADNIRKGAALNGIQIAEQIFNLELNS
jgi:aspartate-semialdehyde dehydrogenase